jgi:chromosome segregation ATPase
MFFLPFFSNLILQNEVRNIVQDEVENLRDDIEEAIRNLHMDMISQFHQQSQELNNVLSAQNATIDRLSDENRRLQEENATLREGRSNYGNGSDDHEFAMH